MEETARPATPGDLERIAELATAAIAELTPSRGGAIWARREARPAPVEASLSAAIDNSDHHVVVGELDGVVVGYAAVRIEVLRDGGLLAMLDDLYVDPEARGVGVGETMMNAVLGWADERGCLGIDSLALPGNRETKNFFESFGLVARAIVVHRPLAGSNPSGSVEP
ncbi:MAG: GNAT family N-acetyltransferase [Acidimicrobiales bacterium]|nr:GNAT family N-acetyltransferase [Acidimicrobiales bacterium]